MRKLFASIFIIAVLPLIGICANTKNIASLHNINEMTSAEKQALCDANIMPVDERKVSADHSASAAAVIFNLTDVASDNASGAKKSDIGPFCHVAAPFSSRPFTTVTSSLILSDKSTEPRSIAPWL